MLRLDDLVLKTPCTRVEFGQPRTDLDLIIVIDGKHIDRVRGVMINNKPVILNGVKYRILDISELEFGKIAVYLTKEQGK